MLSATSLLATLLAWWVSCDSHVTVNITVTLSSSHVISRRCVQIADMYFHLGTAGTVWFAQPDALKGTLVVTLKEAQPNLFFGVPR